MAGYQGGMDGSVPGRPQLQAANPHLRDRYGEPGADDVQVIIPLATGRFGGPKKPRRIVTPVEEDTPSAILALRRRLDRIWADEHLSRAERRARIQEILEDCDDAPSGRLARATITGFLRRHAP